MAVNIPPGSSKDIPLEFLGPETDYCTKCDYPIPEYAFHCSICDKCTLELDRILYII